MRNRTIDRQKNKHIPPNSIIVRIVKRLLQNGGNADSTARESEQYKENVYKTRLSHVLTAFVSFGASQLTERYLESAVAVSQLFLG